MDSMYHWEVGLREEDLRWLVRHGYAEHGWSGTRRVVARPLSVPSASAACGFFQKCVSDCCFRGTIKKITVLGRAGDMAHQPMASLLQYIRQLAGNASAQDESDGHLLEAFLTRRDEAAFATLLQRHGPMVLGIARRLLDNHADAEDVFQATFLVLVRSAGTIHRYESIGSWLHGVASRLARRAKANGARRRGHERQAPVRVAEDAESAVYWRDLRAVLDEELSRLPEMYRAPLVLCYLEGRTHSQAARELGWTDGTLGGRLARARELMRRRLARRGLAVSAGLGAAALACDELVAAVPASLAASTVHLAALLAAPEAALATGLSSSVARLVEGMVQSMFLNKLKMLAAMLLVVGLVATGTGVVAHHMLAQKPGEVRSEGEARPPAREAEQPKLAEGTIVRLDRHGDRLPEEAISRLGTIRLRHAWGAIGLLRFTPDSKSLVSDGSDGSRIWDVATGKQVHFFPKKWLGWHPEGASLSADGKLLAMRGLNGIHLGEVASGNEVRSLGTGRSAHVRFSPDGKILAALGSDNINNGQIERVELWDVATGQQLGAWGFEETLAPFTSAALAAGGKILIAGRADETIGFWDVTTGKRVRQFSVAVRRIAVSPDGTLLAAIRKDASPQQNGIAIWDVASGKELRQLAVPVKDNDVQGLGFFEALAFAPDGKTLVTGSRDGTVIVWNPATSDELQRFAVGSPIDYAVAISPDNRHLAVASGPTIRLIDRTAGKDRIRHVGHAYQVEATAVSSDGRTVTTLEGSGRAVILWDSATGQERRRLEGIHLAPALQMTADGRGLVTAGLDETLRVWDPATGQELRRFERQRKISQQLLALAPNCQTVALGGSEGTVVVEDLRTGQELQSFKGHGKIVCGAAFTPDSRMLITWCNDNRVRQWDVVTGREVRQFVFLDKQGVGGSYTAAVSPHGCFIVFGSQHNFLALHDLATGQEIGRLDQLPEGVAQIAFSPDGRTLAWAGYHTPIIHLVEMATGRECHRFVALAGPVTTLTFSADATTLVSGHSDATALVWDLTGRLGAKQTWGKPLAPAHLDTCWSELAGEDAARAYDAVRRLAASPAQSIPYLRTRLQPAAPVDVRRVRRLITDLDSDDFKTREKAAQELEKIEDGWMSFYQKALENNHSVEVRRRLEALVQQQVQPWRTTSPRRLPTHRSLEVLERAGTPEARQFLEALAGGLPGARLTEEAKASIQRLAQQSAQLP